MNRSGAGLRRYLRVILLAVVLLSSIALNACNASTPTAAAPTSTAVAPDTGDILVYVFDGLSGASIDGVIVRVSNTSLADGIDNRELRLSSCSAGNFLVVSAPRYETSFTACNGSNAYYVALYPLNMVDNVVNYSWLSAYADCGGCHSNRTGEGYNEIAEWETSAHARVFVDPYFRTMYNGTNVNGQVTSATENYGPGFKLDFPNESGDCVYCHAPSALSTSFEPVDLSGFFPRPGGAAGEGVTCDVCHKAYGVALNGDGYPFADRPGVKSFEFLRLPNSFVTGPFSNLQVPAYDDRQRHASSTCASALSSSEFCAACHYGRFNDQLIYNSYGEWRESFYGRDASKSTYKTCQDCHMSHMDVEDVSTPLSWRSACSETTEQYQNFDHNMMSAGSDASDESMIKDAVRAEVKLKYEGGSNTVNVRVKLENVKAGHKIPTDSPLRQLILVVTATDQFEYPLVQVKGDVLPDWLGSSTPAMSQNGVDGYAGKSGNVFASVLVEDATGVSPTASYWKKTSLVSDTRLSPRDPRTLNYAFTVPDLGEIHVNVKLIYRHAFFDLMDQKDWLRPDILLLVADCHMAPGQDQELECEINPSP